MTRSNRVSLSAAVAICAIASPKNSFSAEPDEESRAPSVLAPAASPPRPEAPLVEKSPRPEGRVLAGHVFTPVLGLTGPFATTNFGSFMLLGAGSTEASLTLQLPGTPPPPPQTFSGKVEYVAVGGLLSFEYAFLPGFSARVGISQTIYTGTTGASAAVVGSNARLGGNVGLTAGLPIGQSVRVAAVFDASYAPRLGLVLGPAIQSTFDSCATGVSNCRFDFDDLFQQKNVLTVQPGLAAAWAPARALGITGNVSYVYNRTTASNEAALSQGGVSFAAAVDFDFMGFSSVPLGLQAIWSTLVPFSGGDTSIGYTDLGGGIFYTGRKELSLGIQVVDRRFRVTPDVDVSWNNVVGFIGLRYYW
jgi:hypothetical protein